jgi:hypothetical protein
MGVLIRLDVTAKYSKNWLSILEDLPCLTVLPSDFALRVAGKHAKKPKPKKRNDPN